MSLRLFGLIVLFFSPALALAGEVMFEGYYQIKLEGKLVGYTIQRFEYDPKAKTFDSISFLRAKFGGKVVQESLKAKANDSFDPISYQYTALVDSQVTSIDASFKGTQMKLAKSDGKVVKNEVYKIPPKTVLSSFLIYKLLQKPLAPGQPPYEYQGVAEEDGNVYTGKAYVESKSDKGGISVIRILNSFKGDKFVSYIAAVPDPKRPGFFMKGEAHSSESPMKNISTILVAVPSTATEGQMVPNKTLITLFGGMPTGKMNMISTPPPHMISSPVPPTKDETPKEE